MSEAALTRSGSPVPAMLELLKPITWFAPMWAYGCGIVTSGLPVLDHLAVFLFGVLLAGPMVCGTSQAVNDWFDRHVDAINEPHRPIPSGRLPGKLGLYIAIGWTGLSLLVAATLGPWGFGAAVCGLALAWAYSAACYEGLPWLTGVAVMTGARPDWRVFAIAGLYSAGAHGIMTLNDFKSVEGDRLTGIKSLPVLLGVEGAGNAACIAMALPQIGVVALLLSWGFVTYGFVVSLLLMAQLALMVRLMRDPRELAPWYNATGTTLYVIGMLVTAFAIRPVLAGAG
jgi:chlorophyll synthase